MAAAYTTSNLPHLETPRLLQEKKYVQLPLSFKPLNSFFDLLSLNPLMFVILVTPFHDSSPRSLCNFFTLHSLREITDGGVAVL